jgi:multiple sugar transport system ATP-binding protein
MNLVEATLEASNGTLHASVGEERIAIGSEVLDTRPALKAFEGKLVVLGIRPEDLEDAAIETGAPPDHRLKGKVELTEALGSEIMVHIGVGARPALTEEVRELAEDLGDERAAAESEEVARTTMVGRFSPRSQVNEGDTVEVVVDTSSLHFFDPDTGLGIYDNDQAKGA